MWAWWNVIFGMLAVKKMIQGEKPHFLTCQVSIGKNHSQLQPPTFCSFPATPEVTHLACLMLATLDQWINSTEISITIVGHLAICMHGRLKQRPTSTFDTLTCPSLCRIFQQFQIRTWSKKTLVTPAFCQNVKFREAAHKVQRTWSNFSSRVLEIAKEIPKESNSYSSWKFLNTHNRSVGKKEHLSVVNLSSLLK